MWTQGRKKIEYIRDYVNDADLIEAILAWLPDSEISEMVRDIAKAYNIELDTV